MKLNLALVPYPYTAPCLSGGAAALRTCHPSRSTPLTLNQPPTYDSLKNMLVLIHGVPGIHTIHIALGS